MELSFLIIIIIRRLEMEFRKLVTKSRSYRRFYEDKKIPREILTEIVDCARLIPSAQNLQPLKYIAVDGPETETVFSHLKWAGYLPEWDGPEKGERPAAYIIIINDTEIAKAVKWDHGIAAQTILLCAASHDMGGCIIGSVNRDGLASDLSIPSKYTIELVIALGYPVENVIIDEINSGDSIKYYRDDSKNHHVPKRKLDDILLFPGKIS